MLRAGSVQRWWLLRLPGGWNSLSVAGAMIVLWSVIAQTHLQANHSSRSFTIPQGTPSGREADPFFLAFASMQASSPSRRRARRADQRRG